MSTEANSSRRNSRRKRAKLNEKQPNRSLYIILVFTVVIVSIAIWFFKPVKEETDEKQDIANNLSRFYENFRASSKSPIDEYYGDFVIPIEKNSRSLTEQLSRLTSETPFDTNTSDGEFKYRSFAASSTLKAGLTTHAEKEGLSLIWDLEQDFIIKKRFQSENTLTGIMDEIAGAIDANFDGRVTPYTCPKQRAVVLTTVTNNDFINENCRPIRR